MHRVYKEQSGRLSLHPRLRIILADDHVILRRGLRAILEVEPDLEIIGEATSVLDAVALVSALPEADLAALLSQAAGVTGSEPVASLIARLEAPPRFSVTC